MVEIPIYPFLILKYKHFIKSMCFIAQFKAANRYILFGIIKTYLFELFFCGFFECLDNFIFC